MKTGNEHGNDLPQCVLAMGCYCAGHARGNPASAACDTSELGKNLQHFINAYIECALWSSTRDNGYNMCGLEDELSDETRARMVADCTEFVKQWSDVLDACDATGNHGDSYGMAGHDFWLTRNGHGAGFWDGDWDFGVETTAGVVVDEVAKVLTNASIAFGEYDLYIGDDEKVYGYPPELPTATVEVRS